MKIILDEKEYLMAYVTVEELLDSDEIKGMAFDNGESVFMVMRPKTSSESGKE